MNNMLIFFILSQFHYKLVAVVLLMISRLVIFSWENFNVIGIFLKVIEGYFNRPFKPLDKFLC